MELQRIFIAIIILVNVRIKVVYGDKSETSDTCGRRLVNHEALIVNGYESKEGDWPWHASILHIDIDLNIQYKCGGTLLNSNSILTAAHCVFENSRPLVPDRVLIQLGRNNLKISGPHSQEIEAFQTFPHHRFNSSSLTNDIAIIRLATKATFNKYVQPVCLWDSNKKDLSEVVGKYGSVVGFGITEKNKISHTLRQAAIPVVSQLTCLDSDRSFYGNFISDYTFCAGYLNGTTACNGDSGGSITFEENGVYRIRGIVSLTQVRPGDHNRFCKTDQYVIFTDVAKYIHWIEEIVPGLPSPSTELTAHKPINKIRYCYFLNNDLTNARIGRDDCPERCAATPYCTHYTWTDYNEGTCWMKQNKVSESDAQNYNSDEKSAVCGIVDNVSHIAWNGNDWAFGCDFWQNDMAKDTAISSKECTKRCAATEGCTHFTWNSNDGGTCRMKRNSISKKEAFVSGDNSSICGIVKQIDWNGNNWAIGCDFRGNDLKNVRSDDNKNCGWHCTSNPPCTHFTWNTAFGGTCWLKHYNGVTKSDAVLTLDITFVCGVV